MMLTDIVGHSLFIRVTTYLIILAHSYIINNYTYLTQFFLYLFTFFGLLIMDVPSMVYFLFKDRVSYEILKVFNDSFIEFLSFASLFFFQRSIAAKLS